MKLEWNAEQKYKGQIWCYLEHHDSKIGSGKLKLVLICVCELQKLAIVALKSLSIWLGSIKRTITQALLPITPRSYANRGRDRSRENTVCGDAMDSYPCSPSLDSRPFQVHAEIVRSWNRLGPSLVVRDGLPLLADCWAYRWELLLLISHISSNWCCMAKTGYMYWSIVWQYCLLIICYFLSIPRSVPCSVPRSVLRSVLCFCVPAFIGTHSVL